VVLLSPLPNCFGPASVIAAVTAAAAKQVTDTKERGDRSLIFISGLSEKSMTLQLCVDALQ
jgi:hypothetical protein